MLLKKFFPKDEASFLQSKSIHLGIHSPPTHLPIHLPIPYKISATLNYFIFLLCFVFPFHTCKIIYYSTQLILFLLVVLSHTFRR